MPELLERHRFFTRLTIYAHIGLLVACGGSDCEQDYPPPSERTTSSTPYRIATSHNLEYSSVRWVNQTTGYSGTGTVGTGCVLLFGCGWTQLEVYVDLDPGENLIYVYEFYDGCEWRSDYLVTLN